MRARPINILAPVLGAFAALSCAMSAFGAPQVVTVCGREDAPGGLNLATALSAGGDIVIRCPSGQQAIQFSRTLDVRRIVSVDGEGKVTLRGPVAGPLFTADISVRLARLTVENPVTAATAGAAGAGTIILGAQASVELDQVTTQNSISAFVARSLRAKDSKFQNNGDPASPEGNSSIINADSIDLRNVAFTGNSENPIAGGSPPEMGRPALSHSVVIEDSVFTGNRFTMLLTDARVMIRRTRFESNGAPPEKSGGAWGCCGGAITLVRSDADLSNVEFRANGSSGFGGAIYALGSRLRITQCVFEGNKARAGGAIMFWGQWPKVNIWSTEEWPEVPTLQLGRTQFLRNSATVAGGGLMFSGMVGADAVLFRANVSGGPGGAIADWRSATFPEPYGGVLDGLVRASQPTQRDTLSLARPILVDNVAGGRGAALAAGSAAVAIGNGLIARNQATAGTGGAVSAPNSSLVNTTIADNPAGGLVLAAGSTARLGNSILLRNQGFNCSLGGALSDAGRNFQFPGNDCGASVERRDPGLDGQYVPGLVSAARGSGAVGLCAADPQVRGVDLFGEPRLQRGRCDVGAIERPLLKTLASALGLGSRDSAVPRFLCLLFLLVILLFLLGLCWAIRRRRRRHGRTAAAPRPA